MTYDCRVARSAASPSVALVALAAALAGCKTIGSTDTTGSISRRPAPRSEAEWRREAEALGERFRANPRDADVAIRYAQALRAHRPARAGGGRAGDRPRCINPENKALLGAYGRALADAGNFKQALDVLDRAHTPDQPDWRILSVQGAVLDQMGRHDEAQRYYASALQDRAGRAFGAVQSRALLRAVEGSEARRGRRCAAPRRSGGADRRVRQNLALVVGLQGRFQEAETIARADLPPDEAAANVAYLRQMLAQQQQQRGKPNRKSIKPIGIDPIEDANGT